MLWPIVFGTAIVVLLALAMLVFARFQERSRAGLTMALPPQFPPEFISRPFISYSRMDAAFADAIFEALKARGHAPILDRQDIDPNDQWQERLRELILQSDGVLFLLSPNWLQSAVCKWELRCAEAHGKLLAPVQWCMLDIGQVPSVLSSRNFVDFRKGWPANKRNQTKFDTAINGLIKGLKIADTVWRREHLRWMARADAWHRAGMPEDLLLSTGETAQVQAWASGKPPDEDALPDLLLQFVSASVTASGRLKKIEESVIGELHVADSFAELSADQVRRLPTVLVVADYGIIPYDDSRGLRDDLLNWALETSKPSPAGRLYAAAGGYGKTRLALEAVTILREKHGWRTGLLPRASLETTDVRGEHDADARLKRFFERTSAKGTLLVLDYAESRTAQIERVTKAALASKGARIRIILLSREAGEWWEELHKESREIQLVYDPKPVAAISGDISPEQRKLFFESAASAFAKQLFAAQSIDDVLISADWRDRPIPVKRLAAPQVGSPLSLAFEAFLYVRGAGPTESPLKEMAREERRHWARALRSSASDVERAKDIRIESMEMAAAALTLIQGVSGRLDADLEALLWDVILHAAMPADLKVLDDAGRTRALFSISRALVNLYRVRLNGVQMINPVLPDILGEEIVGLQDAEVLSSIITGLLRFEWRVD